MDIIRSTPRLTCIIYHLITVNWISEIHTHIGADPVFFVLFLFTETLSFICHKIRSNMWDDAIRHIVPKLSLSSSFFLLNLLVFMAHSHFDRVVLVWMALLFHRLSFLVTELESCNFADHKLSSNGHITTHNCDSLASQKDFPHQSIKDFLYFFPCWSQSVLVSILYFKL